MRHANARGVSYAAEAVGEGITGCLEEVAAADGRVCAAEAVVEGSDGCFDKDAVAGAGACAAVAVEVANNPKRVNV